MGEVPPLVCEERIGVDNERIRDLLEFDHWKPSVAQAAAPTSPPIAIG
jgi:hypothetical protein